MCLDSLDDLELQVDKCLIPGPSQSNFHNGKAEDWKGVSLCFAATFEKVGSRFHHSRPPQSKVKIIRVARVSTDFEQPRRSHLIVKTFFQIPEDCLTAVLQAHLRLICC